MCGYVQRDLRAEDGGKNQIEVARLAAPEAGLFPTGLRLCFFFVLNSCGSKIGANEGNSLAHALSARRLRVLSQCRPCQVSLVNTHQA